MKFFRKHQRKIISILAGIMALLMILPLLATIAGTASATKTDEIKSEIGSLKSEYDKINTQKKEITAQLKEIRSDKSKAVRQKELVENEIDLIRSQIDTSNQLITQYNDLIEQKEHELADVQAKEEMQFDLFCQRIRAMEKSGNASYLAVIFNASSFSDLLDRIDQIHEIAEADQRMLKQMETLSEQIELDRMELESELAAQEVAKAALAELEQTLQEQRAAADVLLRDLAVEAETLSAEFLANEDEEAALRALIMSAQSDYEKALSAEEAARLAAQNKNNVAGGASTGGTVSPNSSGFVSPLPAGSTYVSCAYGWRIHPLWGDKRFHYGVDLAANANTPVYAIASGTVTTAAYGDANGYYISLSHGGGYGSVYCHLNSFAVSAGEYVSQGQVIGYVGSTGWSTGPHLHFEIHLNGSTVNPVQYVSVS